MESPHNSTRILAGWAHDMAKPLQVIGDHARRLVKEGTLGDPAIELAREIVELSDDALRVVERLMETGRLYALRGEPTNEPREVSTEELVQARNTEARREAHRDRFEDQVERHDQIRRRKRTAADDTLYKLMRRVVSVVRGLHPGCRLSNQGPIPRVRFPRSSPLASVLVNVVENAIRASEHSQEVTIEARLRDDELIVDVIDRGMGMSTFVRDHAFEAYFSTQQLAHPTGLGLTECRSLMSSIGGQIILKTAEGCGTQISVVVPGEGNWRYCGDLKS